MEDFPRAITGNRASAARRNYRSAYFDFVSVIIGIDIWPCELQYLYQIIRLIDYKDPAP